MPEKVKQAEFEEEAKPTQFNLYEFMRIARERADMGLDADRENRDKAIDDLKVLDGEQWDEQTLAERTEARRPCLTINKLSEKLDVVVGEMRQNRPDIKVIPVDDKADPKVADVMTGLIRNIQRNSDSDTIYDHAGEHAAACGYGAFRVDLEPSTKDFFSWDIKLNRISNALAVIWDPSAEKQDKSDAKWCFVIQDILRDDFRARYPNAQPIDFSEVSEDDKMRPWCTEQTMRIAEYWVKEPAKKEIYQWEDGTITDYKIKGVEPAKIKTVEIDIVKWHLISGTEIIKGPVTWPNKERPSSLIPIIDVVGKELNVGGKKTRRGLVRHAKDPQRAYNYGRSSELEITALAPKTPYLVTDKQIGPYKKYWKNVFKKALAYLPYVPDPRVQGGKPFRETPAQIPSGDAHLVATADQELKSTTGIYDPALGAQSNEVSGVAIRQRIKQSHTGAFAYVDNLGKSLKYAGRVIVDLVPRVYTQARVVRLLMEDNTEKEVTINETYMDQNDGKEKIFDLTLGKYDAHVTVGPSYATKRQEAVDGMIQFMQTIPEKAALMADLAAKNMDWPGADEIARRLRMTLPPELLRSEDGQQDGFDEAEVNAMVQEAIQQFSQTPEFREADAKARKAEADADKAVAQAEEAKVELKIAQDKERLGIPLTQGGAVQ